jgi:Zn-dependent protease/predicted transcriptional regulator
VSSRWKIATIGGVPLYLASSFVWIAVLYTYSLYLGFSEGGVVLGDTAALLLALFSAVLFFGSILAHELAHAVVARAFGLPVAGITLLFWGGATETKADLKGPKEEFLVSAAGPAMSLLMGGLFWLISRALAGPSPALGEAFSYVGFVNVLLAGLNAIPGYPLDGGRVLQAAVWAISRNKVLGTRVAGWAGMVVGVGFGAFGLSQLASGTTTFGVWFLFLAWILISTARGTETRLRLRSELAKGRARDAMRPPPDTVPAEMSLADVLRDYLRGREHDAFPVVEGGRVIGTISMNSARRVGGRDPLRPARDGIVPLAAARSVQVDDGLDDVLDLLGGQEGMVLDDGRLVGSVAPRDVERWYQRHLRGDTDAPAGAVPPRPDL